MSLDVPDEWTFEAPEVADAFDEHVREQLPWYDMVTEGIAQIGRHYIGSGLVYDVGASNGNVGRALDPTLSARGALLIAIEASHEMACRYTGPGEVVVEHAEEFEFERFDFAVCMLALMFLSPWEQHALLDRLVPLIAFGGALVVVERMLPPDGYMGLVTSRLTLAAKAAAGVPAQHIVDKELSLAGVQRPVDPAILLRHGAREWFRFGDFAGYIIESRNEAE